MLASDPSASCNFLAGRGSCLDAGGYWLIRTVAAKGWGDRDNFLKGNEVSLIDWLFLSWTIPLWPAMVFGSILPTVELLSTLESVFSNPAAASSTKFMSYSQFFVVISTVFSASSPGVDSTLRNHFPCSSVRCNSSAVQVLPWDCSHSVTSSGSTSNSSFLAISTTSAVTSPHKGLSPSKSSMRVGINFFQTPVNADILTSSHESWMFLMESRMVYPFQKVFNWLYPDSSKESLSVAAIALQHIFLK